MTLYFDKESQDLKSDVGPDDESRKLTLPDFGSGHGVDVVSLNSEHIVDAAAGLRTLALVAENAAAHARDSLALVRTALLSNKLGADLSERSSVFSMDDLEKFQRLTAVEIASLSADPRQLEPAIIGASKTGISSFVPEKRQAGGSGVNTAIPEIDYLSIDFDKRKGVADGFSARLVFSIPRSRLLEGSIRAIRIFRSVAPMLDLEHLGVFSMHALDRLSAGSLRTRSKNLDELNEFEHRFRELGIKNSLTNLIPIDPLLNGRTSADIMSGNIHPAGQPRSAREALDASSFIRPTSLGLLDRSVILDLKTMRNIQLQNPDFVPPPSQNDVFGRNIVVDSGDRLAASQVEQMRSKFPSPGTVGLLKSNEHRFDELGIFSPDKLANKVIGDLVEFTFDDNTIRYGQSLGYYVTTVDTNMQESVRSKIVRADVNGMRIPQNPREVSSFRVGGFIALSIDVADQFVEKFEIYRKDVGAVNDRVTPVPVAVVSGKDGFVLEEESRLPLKSGFVQVGEVINGVSAGALFYDRSVLPGRTYLYRVFSVDIFGNKSESPKEISVFVSDPEQKHVDLKKPTILAQVDAKTAKVLIKMSSDDDQVTTLFLARRELTIHQHAFSTPGDVNHVKLGNPSPKGPLRFHDVRLFDQRPSGQNWSGFFQKDGNDVTFLDESVDFDRVYQYTLYGMDRFGNRTSFEISRPVFVSRRPLVNEPINLSASILFGDDRQVRGVRLEWQDGNLDITPADRIGNREDLKFTEVRTLFQVERKRLGEEKWAEFPLVEDKFLEDLTSGPTGPNVPNYRPSYIELDRKYVYRVAAYQTGGFISNFSDQLLVHVTAPLVAPVNFRINPADPKFRPFFLMLNWDTDPRSSGVDFWEIQRAEVNNFAAANLNPKSPDDVSILSFEGFRNVYSESSRFRERTDDRERPGRLGDASRLMTGQHHFMDTKIRFGNTYFYRIRAVGVDGLSRSAWTYRGAKVTDGLFERKAGALLSTSERHNLSTNLVPLAIKSDYLSSAPVGESSFSFNQFVGRLGTRVIK